MSDNERDIFDISEPKNFDGSLGGKFRHKWVEESFCFEKETHKQIEEKRTSSYLGTGIGINKLKIFAVIFLLGMLAVGGKIFYLQVIKGGYYRDLAEGNRIRLRPIAAERGIIFDRNGRELVQNVPSFSLTVVPRDLPIDADERRDVIEKIAVFAGVTPEYITDLIMRYGPHTYESLAIRENLDYDAALQLYAQHTALPGVLIESGTKRHYLNAVSSTAVLSLSHLIGYLGKLDDAEFAENSGYLPSDYIGKIGLEKFYEKDLRGIYGRKKIEVDALGHEQAVLAETPPVPGKNLYLTVDIDAQAKLEEIVARHLKNTGKKRAAAVAMDPRDGSILALVSYPAFDNNDFSGGITQENYDKYVNNPNRPLFNRAIAGTYPSGSIIKFAVAAAALQEKIVRVGTYIASVGGIEVGDRFFKDWRVGGHGSTNVIRALAWSVNTYFYYIGGGYKTFEGLGFDKMMEYFRKFGLAEKTGIDLTGEKPGFLPSREWKLETKNERWYIGDTYNLSIGQGDLLVTPLQAAVWTSAIANGGKIVRPHLVESFLEPDDNEPTMISYPAVRDDFISAENIDIVKQGARACVREGSCTGLAGLPFATGGKTGTAQWSSNKPEHAWFTSFAPYDNPRIVVTVLVEEGGEGGTASLPIARDFLYWWGIKNIK